MKHLRKLFLLSGMLLVLVFALATLPASAATRNAAHVHTHAAISDDDPGDPGASCDDPNYSCTDDVDPGPEQVVDTCVDPNADDGSCDVADNGDPGLDASVQCRTAHIEINKRNGNSDTNIVARYVMNKHFCFNGQKVTQSDQADVRGYVSAGLTPFFVFKGNISTQNGSTVDGSSTAQGNFEATTSVSANFSIGIAGITFSKSDLGVWQPSITIVPLANGGFNYAPSSGYNGNPSTIHDIVRAYFV